MVIRAQRRVLHSLAVMEETGVDLDNPGQIEEIKALSRTDDGANNIAKLLQHAKSKVDGEMLRKITELGNRVEIKRVGERVEIVQ